MKLIKYQLRDIGELFDGPHATPAPSDSGPIFLGIKNFNKDGRLDLSEIRHVSEDQFQQWTKRVLPQPGDIVFTYEATLHRYAIIPEGIKCCLGRRTALLRLNQDIANPWFVLYVFMSDAWRSFIESQIVTGATVDRIPLTKAPLFPIELPDKPTQDKIVNVINDFDALISNCTKRIELLTRGRDLLLPRLMSGSLEV